MPYVPHMTTATYSENNRPRDHAIEEVVSIGTSGGVLIGCVCGWVHTERSVYKAREKARRAYAAHKSAEKES